MNEPSTRPFSIDPETESKRIHWEKEQDVLIAGEPSRCIYMSRDAWLARYKILHDGSRQIIDFVLPGDIFGLQACVFRSSLYTVTAITSGTGWQIDCDGLDAAVPLGKRVI